MVKVGVYFVGRLRPVFIGAEWTLVLATVGLVTMTVCAVLAVLSTDIKELLAYSTASHLGLMIAGFGFASHYGAEAGVFHLLNHALFKAALFLVAGVIAHEAGTRSLEELDEMGGLGRDLPVTAVVAVAAALSMAGVPPFGGFYSKEIFFEAAWTAAETSGGLAWLYPVTAVFASVFTVLYSLRFAGIFVGKRLTDAAVHRPSAALVAPPAVLAAGVLAVSLVPSFFVDGILNDAADVASVAPVEIHAGLPTEVSGPVLMSAVTLTAGFVVYPFYGRVRGGVGAASGVVRRIHPKRLYDGFLTNLGATSNHLAATVHNGLIRTYVAWVLVAACGLTLLGYAALSVPVVPDTFAFFDTQVAMLLVLAVAIVAAVAVTTASSHVTGVLTLGILGFMVAIFYILASAPDLALTQLVVETLLLLIFLLVLERIPAFYSEFEPRVAARDVALSVVVGATAFVSVLVAAPESGADLTETARTYVDRSVPDGGGTNVVNVVLTDFRAFDTLGESVVVLVAALSVLVLVVMRGRGERR
jgi:multicomponent Na+:H+ antiporter subunit A